MKNLGRSYENLNNIGLPGLSGSLLSATHGSIDSVHSHKQHEIKR